MSEEEGRSLSFGGEGEVVEVVSRVSVEEDLEAVVDLAVNEDLEVVVVVERR